MRKPEPPLQLTLPQVLDVRERFEMGDGLFREITGIEVSQIFAFRRGRLKVRPTITPEATARIRRCEELLSLAIELIGNEEKALDWLYSESPTFGGRSPIDLTINDAAADVVRGYVAKLRAAVVDATSPSVIPKTSAQADLISPTDATNVQPAPVPPGLKPIPIRPEKKTVEASGGLQDSDTVSNPLRAPSPPVGVSPEDRIFRIKEPLAKIRALRPELTLKRISEMMTERGHKQFASSSYMSRLANSYTWATWSEVVALAGALGVSPQELGGVYTLPATLRNW